MGLRAVLRWMIKMKFLKKLGIVAGGVMLSALLGCELDSSGRKPYEVPELDMGSFYNMINYSDKPSAVVFHTEWCGYCPEYMEKFDRIAPEYKDELSLGTIDVTEDYWMLDIFQMRGVPTTGCFHKGWYYPGRYIEGDAPEEEIREGLEGCASLGK